LKHCLPQVSILIIAVFDCWTNHISRQVQISKSKVQANFKLKSFIFWSFDIVWDLDIRILGFPLGLGIGDFAQCSNIPLKVRGIKGGYRPDTMVTK
jgi:hypothetical protein